MCHSLILVLPSEVRDEAAWDGQEMDLLFALSRLSILTFVEVYISELFEVRVTV